MAGYQSMYGSGTTAPAKSDGNYHSLYGFTTQANPSAQQLAQLRQQQAAQAMQNQVQQKATPQHQTLLNRLTGAVTDIGKAGKAIVKPISDVATGQGGKAMHDTAQLTSDVTGGTVNQFAKGVSEVPSAVAGEIASQSKDPFVRAQGVQAVQGAQQKAFGTNDSGTIAKKIVGSTVGTASLFAGGGELAGAKNLLSAGAKVVGKQVAKDTAIGATGNAAATVTQNPNASAKQVEKSAAVGGLLGSLAPHAIKGAGDAGRAGASKIAASDSKLLQPVKDVANTVTGNVQQGQNDLLQAKQNALLSRAQSFEAPQTSATHVPVTPHVAYEPTNPRVKTLVDSAQKQQQAAEAPMKAAQAEQDKAAAQADKAQTDSQKIDRQIELLQAKAKDSETGLSNVDKTKLQHLQQDKAQVGGAPQPTASPEIKPNNVISISDRDGNITHHELSGTALDQYNQAKATHDSTIKGYSKDQTSYGDARRKQAGMEFSAAKRQITGSLTPIEKQTILNKEKSVYVGKQVEINVNGKTVKGTVAGPPAFGNVRLKLEDGSTISVKHGDIPVDKRGIGEILAPYTQKEGVKPYNPTAPVEPVAKPVSESPNVAAPAKAETAQPTVAKENAAPVNNSAKVEAPSTNTKTNETPTSEKPVATEAPATRTLKPSETAHMPEIGGYTHSTQLAQDYADTLRGQELQAKGGQMVKNIDGSYKRISEHSPFYRAVFKETGKAPTKTQYLEQAAKELENNKDGLGAGDVYKQLLEREGKPVPRVQVESTVKDVPQGDSKVAQRIAADIKRNFGEQYKDGAKYDKITIADQAAKAEKLVSNREELDKVISGEKPLPEGLRATSIVTAIRNTPELAKDGELLRRLASSPISSEASYSAQELRLAAENAKNDPVAAIKSIAKAKQDAFKAKTGKSANAAAQSEIKQIRAATPKATVTPKTWNDFVESIKCH